MSSLQPDNMISHATAFSSKKKIKCGVTSFSFIGVCNFNTRWIITNRWSKIRRNLYTLFLRRRDKWSNFTVFNLSLKDIKPWLDLFINHKGNGLTRCYSQYTRCQTLIECSKSFLLPNLHCNHLESFPTWTSWAWFLNTCLDSIDRCVRKRA